MQNFLTVWFQTPINWFKEDDQVAISQLKANFLGVLIL